MNMRLQGWQQFEYDLLGVLYWDVVQWTGVQDMNPYNSLYNVNHDWGAGEGILLYPGQPYGVKKPISSIRLENIFQAQEDYEYLVMLNNFVSQYNVLQPTRLLRPWDFPGKSTGVGCHCLLHFRV